MKDVKGETLRIYNKEVLKFLFYCEEFGIHVTSLRGMDNALATYGNGLFAESRSRGSRQAFVNCVMGVEKFLPYMKQKLVKCRAAYNGWGLLTPTKSPPPLPLSVLLVVSSLFYVAGLPDVGVSLVLAFHTYLRIGELCALRWRDVFLPGDSRLSGTPVCGRERFAGILLRHAKTGNLQFVPISWPFLIHLLRRARRRHDASSRVCPLSPARLRKALHTGLQLIGCGEMGFVPHSLRHGGATYDFMAGVDPSTIQLKGRWRSRKSFLRYLQAGRGLVLALDLPARVGEKLPGAVRRLGVPPDIQLF